MFFLYVVCKRYEIVKLLITRIAVEIGFSAMVYFLDVSIKMLLPAETI